MFQQFICSMEFWTDPAIRAWDQVPTQARTTEINYPQEAKSGLRLVVKNPNDLVVVRFVFGRHPSIGVAPFACCYAWFLPYHANRQHPIHVPTPWCRVHQSNPKRHEKQPVVAGRLDVPPPKPTAYVKHIYVLECESSSWRQALRGLPLKS